MTQKKISTTDFITCFCITLAYPNICPNIKGFELPVQLDLFGGHKCLFLKS